MYFGTYEHSLDDKNRFVIPSKWRKELTNKVVLLKGFDGALTLFESSAFKKFAENLVSLSFNKKVNRDYARSLLASTSELDVDNQGRIVIPPFILKKYNISKEIVALGVGDHVELWDKKTYEEYDANAEKEFESNAEKLEK